MNQQHPRTDDPFEDTTPSRRQVLAGLGAIALGSAGILASSPVAAAQTPTEVEAERHGRRYRHRNRNRNRNRRRNRRRNRD